MILKPGETCPAYYLVQAIEKRTTTFGAVKNAALCKKHRGLNIQLAYLLIGIQNGVS